MRSIKFAKHKILLIPLSMLAITLIAGYFLSHIPLGANATTSDVSLHVADTCTMNGVINEGDEHTVSLINGQERTGIGITRLTTLCNDNNGYAIYAIGYSGTTSDPHNTAGELGRTDLVGLSTGLTISTANWADRNTGDNATKSIWSMSLQDNSEVISTMKPTIENGFSNYLAVPTTYTKVASFPAATGATLATASIVNTTYAAKVAAVQSSDTYVGQVKYTMVHPSSNSATGFTFDDAFQLAGKSRVSGTSYFAMQDMNAAICNKVTELDNNFPETQLIDTRDNNIYTIKKINGDCWMTQNLRFTGTTLTPVDSNVSANTTMAYYSLDSSDASYTDHCDSTNAYNYACIKDSGNDTTGVWYNYVAASAGTITTDDNTTVSNYSVCPKGWKMPSGPANDAGSDFYSLYNSLSTQDVLNQYLIAFNAVDGGFYRYANGNIYHTNVGIYWSTNPATTTTAYAMQYVSDQPSFLTDDAGVYRYAGLYVRCLANDSMQTFDSAAASSLAINESITLRDSRDNQEYTVAKLKDGKVWMTKNLNLAGGTTLTPADSDVAENYTLPASSTTGFDNDGATYAYVYNSGNNDDSFCDETNKQPCYSYYSYNAATAMSGTSITTNNTDAPYSICPAGWRLPTSRSTVELAQGTPGSDFYKMAINYGLNPADVNEPSDTDPTFCDLGGDCSTNTVPRFLRAGVYRGSEFYNGGANGYYWSSTAHSSTVAHYLSLYSGNVYSNDGNTRGHGVSVRCLLK